MENTKNFARLIIVPVIASVLILLFTISCANTTGSGETPGFFTFGDPDFYKVRKNGGDWTNSLVIEANDKLEFRIHFHNTIGSSNAHDTRVNAILPEDTIVGNNVSWGGIGCKEADPSVIRNDVILRSNEVLILDYIEGSTFMEKRAGSEEYYRHQMPDGIITEGDNWPLSIGDVVGAGTSYWDGYVYFLVSVVEP